MKKKIIIPIIAVLVLAGLGIGYYVWQYNLGYHECIVEAGYAVTPQDLLTVPDDSAVFDSKSQTVDTYVPGDYLVRVKTKFFVHKCTVHVVDTVAPEAVAKDFKIVSGEPVNPEDFLEYTSDATKLTYEFVEVPDNTSGGTRPVSVRVIDAGGNECVVEANLTVSLCKEVAETEAGSEVPDVKLFLLVDTAASFKEDINPESLKHVGEYPVKLVIDGDEYDSVLKVVDTVAPAFDTVKLERYTGQTATAEDFVTEVTDVTECTVAFVDDPDFTKAGDLKVSIVVTDEGGNETVKEADLTVIEDTEAPVITGVRNLTVFKGQSVAFKNGVTVSDNSGEELSFSVDTGNFNYNEPGNYDIVYSAEDLAGNRTDKKIVVTVVDRDYSDEAVYAEADKILARIINDNMTMREKAWAIFDYTYWNIRYYSGSSPKISWQQGAMDGFIEKKGDCYIYACVSKVLLTRAGIPNLDITRDPESTRIYGGDHYWNLVNLGDGWYHFDALPMKDGTKFFMWTNAQCKEYDDTKLHLYHAFDASLYPEIQ